MKRQYTLIGLILLALLSAGCQQDEKASEQSSLINPASVSQEADDTDKENDPSADMEAENTAENEDVTEEKAEEEQEEAGELTSQQMIDQAMAKRNSVDIAQSVSLKEEMTVPAEQEGWEDRTITIYSSDQQILKMTVTEPTDSGTMSGLTSYWFDEGEVFYIQEPFASYVFHGDTLVAWMDENLNILYDDPASDVMKDRKQRLLNDMIKWLDAFHAEYK